MTGTTYGNGTTVTKQFDAVDRVTDVLYNGVEAYHYDYTANGSLGTTVDSVNGNVWRYEYDLKSGRLARAVCSTGLEFRYTYDLSKDRLTSTTRVDNGVTTTVNYIYDNYDRLSEVSYSDGTRVTYSYDFIDRLSGRTFYNGTDRVYGETYSYETILGSDGITTEETYRVNSVAVSSNGYDVTYSYTYDGWGNITSVSQDDSVLIEYEYDNLCQLIGANDYQNGQYITYTYDKGGNITSKTWHDDAGNSFSRSYSYGDESWGDLLTSYDGKAITYDGVGNMLTYGTRSFSWMMGRRLAGITDTGLTTSYSYDSDGVRTQKTVNGVVTDYILDGGQVVGEKSGSNYISYEYDAAGKLVAMVYNGTKYYYVTNAMGDVLGLMNTSGDMVVNYRYDPYGQVLSVNGSMASTIGAANPFRYRGYYYDTETGLYYVSSRYYNPEIGRWINADGEIAGVGGDILGYNLFAYCFNNPVNMSDHSGHWPQWIKDAANWVNNNIVQPVANFFSPKTNTISGQFQDGIFRGSGSLTGGYSEFNGRLQVNSKNSKNNGMLGGYGKVSVGNASGKIGIGNDNAALSLKGVGDVLTATAQAGIQYKNGAGLAAKAKASVLSGRATAELELFGWQIEFGVSGDLLSVGAEAMIGIFPDEGFTAKASVGAGLFGGGFVFRVKPKQ